jgi:hypothetical protein
VFRSVAALALLAVGVGCAPASAISPAQAPKLTDLNLDYAYCSPTSLVLKRMGRAEAIPRDAFCFFLRWRAGAATRPCPSHSGRITACGGASTLQLAGHAAVARYTTGVGMGIDIGIVAAVGVGIAVAASGSWSPYQD